MAPPAQSSKGSKETKRRLEAQEGPSEADEHTGPRCDARPFEKEELKAMRLDDLRDIVNAQRDNINTPLPLKFKTYKANKPTLIDVLLDPAYGFTTRKARLSFVPGFGVQKGPKRHKTGGAAVVSKTTPLVCDDQAGPSSNVMLDSAVCFSNAVAFDSSTFSGVPAMTFDGLYSFTAPPTSTEILTLYIHDTRDAVLGHLPDMVQLNVPMSCNLSGQKVANWNEIIQELQKTASAITGENLKLSYARSAEDGYKIAILKALGSTITEAPITQSELVLNEGPWVYHLYVESVSRLCLFTIISADPRVPARFWPILEQILEQYSATSKDATLLSLRKIRKRGRARSLITQDAAARDKEWLESAFKGRDGYDTFVGTRHGMKKTYAEVAEQWEFAVSFLNEYTRKKFPHSGKEVLARHVWSVVSRQGTWFRDAREGHRLYQIHRDHPDIVAAVQNPSLTGRAEFLALLRRVAGL
ncbi:hypothetical protein K525DRAFT_284419 [Schizophyllum commune Loenen D]|nr:hypothetical protein K525DRAFT_284419 [Schizophyllum commune Loenen D]